MTTSDLRAMISVSFPAASYATMWEVADSTGAGAGRHADAVIASLWPSRGLTLEGIEIKVSRGDWLRELKNPEKAEPIFRFCDYWTIVAAPGVVMDGELPPTWGLMVPKANKLVRKVRSPRLEPKQISRPFLAALLRAGTKDAVRASQESLRREFEKGRVHEQDIHDRVVRGLEAKIKETQQLILDFEKESGITLRGRYWGGRDPKAVGRVVNEVLEGKHKQDAEAVQQIRNLAAHIVEHIDASGVLDRQEVPA